MELMEFQAPPRPIHDQTTSQPAFRRPGHPAGRRLLEGTQYVGSERTTNRAGVQQLGGMVALGDRR